MQLIDVHTATAAVVSRAGEAPVLADLRVSELEAGEVLVEIGASGICHTDLTAMRGGVGFPFPAVFGHEGAGTIVAVAEDVESFAPGDRVILAFDACGTCRSCRADRPAYCFEFAARNYSGQRASGVPTLSDATGAPVSASWLAQSSWSTHAIARTTNVVRMPDDVPFDVGAALGCGVLTGACTLLNVLAPAQDDRVLVVGAGVVGLSAVMAARAMGCAQIAVIEPDPARRAIALDLGASQAMAPGDSLPGPRSYARVLDTVGTQDAVDAALGHLAPGGQCATVALRPGENRVTISQGRLLWGRSLRGVIEGDAVPSRDLPRLIGLWRAGLLPVERLISTYAFTDLDQALAAAAEGRALKAVLLMSDIRWGALAEPVATQASSAGAKVRAIASAGAGSAAELTALWDVLPVVTADELRGLWRGTGIDSGHRVHATLEGARWFGKNFIDADSVQPIVCRDDSGALVARTDLAGGGAYLSDSVHRGRLTATMSYDGRPVHDHFVRVDEDAVLGVMAGRGALDDGAPYFFLLERDDTGEVGLLPSLE